MTGKQAHAGEATSLFFLDLLEQPRQGGLKERVVTTGVLSARQANERMVTELTGKPAGTRLP
jgi:hypothetical protein